MKDLRWIWNSMKVFYLIFWKHRILNFWIFFGAENIHMNSDVHWAACSTEKVNIFFSVHKAFDPSLVEEAARLLVPDQPEGVHMSWMGSYHNYTQYCKHQWQQVDRIFHRYCNNLIIIFRVCGLLLIKSEKMIINGTQQQINVVMTSF